jgi:hypothetical protein
MDKDNTHKSDKWIKFLEETSQVHEGKDTKDTVKEAIQNYYLASNHSILMEEASKKQDWTTFAKEAMLADKGYRFCCAHLPLIAHFGSADPKDSKDVKDVMLIVLKSFYRRRQTVFTWLHHTITQFDKNAVEDKVKDKVKDETKLEFTRIAQYYWEATRMPEISQDYQKPWVTWLELRTELKSSCEEKENLVEAWIKQCKDEVEKSKKDSLKDSLKDSPRDNQKDNRKDHRDVDAIFQMAWLNLEAKETKETTCKSMDEFVKMYQDSDVLSLSLEIILDAYVKAIKRKSSESFSEKLYKALWFVSLKTKRDSDRVEWEKKFYRSLQEGPSETQEKVFAWLLLPVVSRLTLHFVKVF